MKKLLIGLLVLTSITSFAGSIENKKSGQIISFDIIEEGGDKLLVVDATDAGRKKVTILLKNVDAKLENRLSKENESFDPVFMITKECERNVVQLASHGCGVAIVFALGFDLLTLPITLPAKLIHAKVIKKDFNKINEAIYRDYVEVNPRRFNRILKALKL